MHLNAADQAACATLLRGGSRSFHAASRLLPATVCRAATALYAFCRVADDAIDDVTHADRPAALVRLRARLDAIYAGAPEPRAPDRAFAAVVTRHGIPYEIPSALLEGFAWDAEGRRYDDLAGLHEYAVRVAGTVGAMMTLVMGNRNREVLARAMELGMAMQLSNIARDVGEDARAGRLYLPVSWLREAGIEPEAFLADPVYTPALRDVVARLLEEAERLYAQAEAGIAHLPAACRPGIHAARLLYAAIGRTAGGAEFNPVTHRAVVPGKHKGALVLRALPASLRPAKKLTAIPPPAVHALLSTARLPLRPLPGEPLWAARESRVIWVIDLFAALDARQRGLESPSLP